MERLTDVPGTPQVVTPYSSSDRQSHKVDRRYYLGPVSRQQCPTATCYQRMGEEFRTRPFPETLLKRTDVDFHVNGSDAEIPYGPCSIAHSQQVMSRLGSHHITQRPTSGAAAARLPSSTNTGRRPSHAEHAPHETAETASIGLHRLRRPCHKLSTALYTVQTGQSPAAAATVTVALGPVVTVVTVTVTDSDSRTVTGGDSVSI